MEPLWVHRHGQEFHLNRVEVFFKYFLLILIKWKILHFEIGKITDFNSINLSDGLFKQCNEYNKPRYVTLRCFTRVFSSTVGPKIKWRNGWFTSLSFFNASSCIFLLSVSLFTWIKWAVLPRINSRGTFFLELCERTGVTSIVGYSEHVDDFISGTFILNSRNFECFVAFLIENIIKFTLN